MKQALGIDIGGSGIKGAPVDLETGRLLAERLRIATPHPSAPRPMIEAVAEIARHFDWEGPVGCGFPALLKSGVVTFAPNLDQSWIGENVPKLVGKATGLEATVLNDADAAGFGESTFGAGREMTGTIFVITVGTGIGTALIVEGHLVRNTELGHLRLAKGEKAEDIASDRVRKANGLKWREWAAIFQRYLAELEFLFSPDLFIIGGGASKKLEKFEKHLDIEVPIVAAELLNEAGIVGAALAAGQAG